MIRRAQQYILTIKDHFSSLQDALIITSEKAEDLKQGLIRLTTAMRRSGKISVIVDNAKGFVSLIADKDLIQLKMIIQKTEEFNKNANAVIDKN